MRLFEASTIIRAIPGPESQATPIRAVCGGANPVSERDIMTEHSLWRFSRALHRAINERQREDLEAVIDDEVDWAIYGPIDMFPFFGARRGKLAVLEVVRQIAESVRVYRFDRESVMLGVDSAASMIRYSLTALDTNKAISLRTAHFAQFKAGRLVSLRVLVDTFDLVEQALGRPVHLPKLAP
jgi:ketosteroid isomerase-like protein